MDIETILATLPFAAFSLFVSGCAIWGWTYMGWNFKNAQKKSMIWPILGSLCLVIFWASGIYMATQAVDVRLGHILFLMACLVFSVFFHAGFKYEVPEE